MHYHRHDITGKLYKITMRWTQLELGFPDPFYKYKYEKCKNYITSTIITDLWEYISLCNATLREQQPWTYTPPRHNDFFLNYVVFRSNIPNEHKQIKCQRNFYEEVVYDGCIFLMSCEAEEKMDPP